MDVLILQTQPKLVSRKGVNGKCQSGSMATDQTTSTLPNLIGVSEARVGSLLILRSVHRWNGSDAAMATILDEDDGAP
ncbi:hypothetical protein ACLOJK_037548 [Asimina triloba]